MRPIILLAAFLLPVSCSHVVRQPATEQAPPSSQARCALAFQNFLNQDLIESGEGPKVRYVSFTGQANYLLESGIPEYTKRLQSIRTQNLCARQMEISEIENVVELWNGAYQHSKERARLLKLIRKQAQSGPFFNDPQYGNKLVCMYDCDEPAKCVKKCKAEGFSEFNKLFPLDNLAMSCVHVTSDGQPVFSPENFVKNFNRYVPGLHARINEIIEAAEEVIEVSAKVQEKIAPLAAAVKAMKKKPSSCKNAASDMSVKMEPSILYIDNTVGTGSGFLVDVKNETRIVTAYHMFSLDLGLTWEPQKSELFFRKDFLNRKSQGVPYTFNPKAGRFARMSDVLQVEFPTPHPTLKVIQKGRFPSVDQKFWSVGFPGSSNGLLRAIPCQFYGITQALNGQGARYVFNCENGAEKFPGMSGGPLVDEDGTAWGVNTNVSMITGQLIVSPIFRDDDGEVRHGMPQYQVVDLCLQPKNWSRHERCQLMENQYEENIP